MYIGITGYNHESSAALVDGKGFLIDYFREESLSRIKGDKSFPKRSLAKLFVNNNLSPKDIKYIAFYERPMSAFLTTLKTAALNLPESLGLISHQCRNFNKSSISCFLDILKIYPGLEKKLIYLDHHLSHTLTGLVYSDKQSNICSVVVDGFGDRSTASISIVNNCNEIRELWSSDYPASLGLYFSAITDFLGFQINEGEYKVMGLASYGNSNSSLAKEVANLIKWNKEERKIILDMSYFSFHISAKDSYNEKLSSLIGDPRNPFVKLQINDTNFQNYADIARGAQDAVVKILTEIFNLAYSLTGIKDFLFSGGVAMNSSSIEKIAALPFVNEIVIPPSPGDAGAAIGAGYYAFIKNNPKKVSKLNKPSLFPTVINNSSQYDLAKKIISENFKIISQNEDESLCISAKLITEGEVIGTVLKYAETGPRSLGNRSLICDGKNIEAVIFLNTVIKNRSPFRPTAPSMKLETAHKYYEVRKELLKCYSSMSATCKCKEDNKSILFPTTHVDATARIQIVEKGQFLFDMLTELEKYGIDILANSSLNLSGDPTCLDLIDALMVSARNPLKYLLTDFGLLEKIK